MVNNVNAQKWLDDKYPIDGVCKRDNDSGNKGKRREEITELDISKGKVGKGYFSEEKNLIGSLKLASFTKLRKLIISSHQITELDVSKCNNLVELDCQNNQIDNLNITGCSSLKIINCSSNHIKELDLSTCTSLEEVDINNCPNLTIDKIKSELYHDTDNEKLVKGNSQKETKTDPRIRKIEDNDIRNILIVGMTGSGKSTLANVLSDTDTFIENNSSTSVTKSFQTSNIFSWKGKKYRIIDNIGFGDTANISNDDILIKIGEGIHSAKEGLNQVLFVFKDRFSESQIVAFNLFKDFINETGITKFTTLVRTNFEPFEDLEECEKDRQSLLTQTTQTIKEIVDSCNNVVYVDNPPIPVIKENDNESIRAKKEDKANINREKRKQSIEIVLNHLVEKCSEIYKLKEWDSIYIMVDNYIKRKEQIKQSNSSNKEQELKQVKSELVKKVDKSIKGSVGMSVPGLPVEFNIAGEYITHIEVPAKNN